MIEVGDRIVGLLSDAGVRFVGAVSVKAVDENSVSLDNGVTIDCDLVLAATGVTPRSALAADAGITTRDGRIVVDERMHTSAPNVLAAGDVALALERHSRPADRGGALAGRDRSGSDRGHERLPVLRRCGTACPASGRRSARRH